jgi:pSer/pThr/pTyr-binding forkhead associated (FHA) protein
VSRRHFRLRAPAPGEVVVEDLSRAGTFVDGSRISAPLHLKDLRDRSHAVLFGRGERVELSWVPRAGAP